MLGIGGSKPLAGSAEDAVNCSFSKVYHFKGPCFFANYPKWCPQVAELEQLAAPFVAKATKGLQVT
jgi:hypothetical protein